MKERKNIRIRGCYKIYALVKLLVPFSVLHEKSTAVTHACSMLFTSSKITSVHSTTNANAQSYIYINKLKLVFVDVSKTSNLQSKPSVHSTLRLMNQKSVKQVQFITYIF